ncbi:hypothetical protein MMC13_003616 [Lambiella insularis]|nr:hypothetical protein [Lambiella insularis]
MASLRLQLSKPDGRDSYSPGDAVCGLVYIDSSYDAEQVKRIEVVFSGRSEIECIQRESHYQFSGRAYEEHRPWHGNCRIIYFDNIQTIGLFDDTHYLPSGVSHWPFSFVFPAVSNTNQQLRPWRSSTTLSTVTSEPGITLPPSLSSYEEDWPTTSGPGVPSMIRGRANVMYELEARLVGRQGDYIRHDICTGLPFTPTRGPLTAQPTYFRKEHSFQSESRQLLPGVDRFSLRSSAKNFLAKPPVSAFKIITELPRFSTMGQPLSIYLGVDYDLEKSTATELPPVLLREVRVGFLEQIQLGVRRPLYATDRVSTIQSRPKRRFIQHVFKKENMARVTERMNLHQSLPPDKLLVNDLSFETPNLRRFYHDFFLTATLVCAGKEFTASVRTGAAEFCLLAPSAPPRGIELPDSRLLPPEAQSDAVHEVDSRAAVNELQSEPLHEQESNMRSDRLQKAPAYELPAPLSR